jgi:peptidoglycan/xylan/chitin deacetylase (PgdA/CDA1 family)
MTADDQPTLTLSPTARLTTVIRRRRAAVTATLVVVVLGITGGLTACLGHSDPGANAPVAPVVATTGAAASPSLSPSASPSPSPSPAGATASPSSARTSNKPAPSATHPSQNQATGHGPAGSQSVTGTRSVALTFDDGPDPVTTPTLLALLRQYHVKATFCLIGYRARDYPDLVRQIAADGHTLCNHSWQHLLNLGQRDLGYQTWDLTQTTQAMQNAVPGAQVNWFRAPGGNFTTGLVNLATSLGMGSLYWSIDPRDWDNSTYGTGPTMVNHIVSIVESQVRPGSIILSHDRKEHPDTITAYRTLIPWLLDHGYTLSAM